MNTTKLAGTDLEISEIGFGGIPIIALSKAEAESIVRYCFDLGITFFDTANMYFSSEDKIGTALESVREKVVIATKMESVAECIECGECEQKCPYNLPITDLLKENLALCREYS
jgi:aryl-alcohol dehydrogenase-like predicted oxidoreductase